MKIVKMLFLGIILFFGILNNVFALDCNNMSELKKISKNIDVKYEYLGMFNDSDNDDFLTDKYHIIIQGLTENLAIEVDDGSKNKKIYRYQDTKNGTIEFDTFLKKYNFLIYALDCSLDVVRTIPLELKKKNLYAYDDRCEELKKYNLDVCDEWYQGDITTDEFYAITDKYYINEERLSKRISKFLQKNSLILGIIISALIVGGGVIFIRNYIKRSVLK